MPLSRHAISVESIITSGVQDPLQVIGEPVPRLCYFAVRSREHIGRVGPE